METNAKKPIFEKELNLSYTKGLYKFFCKTVASVAIIVFSILEKAKETISGEKAKTLVNCLWVVNHMALKLEGISSISSSVCDNVLCKMKQAIKDCICAFCYAFNQQSYQTGLKEHNILNGIILRNVLIPVSTFKALKILFPYLRIESFGDVANVIQARNYIRLIKAFPQKRCAIWSKNILIWEQAFKIEGKPNNTTFVHSSHKLNKADNLNLNRFTFVDHIFTVYTKKYIKENNIKINCGGKKCIECIMAKKNCYYRNTEFYINEEKK